ncbi:hypothetical protein L3Q82_015413 [Scortum barcoo]|uniref:Uncharacterized protein n=1 Tax=Scortum barcoo TaxID=214431 RepID=A0ACB8VTK6_9TELE|nr:hypothetical protein L3Q82_015413 [Scortum barcoo]
MFFDFSSAFNTIQPRLLGDKLQLAGVDHHLTSWILDYLTHTDHSFEVFECIDPHCDSKALVKQRLTAAAEEIFVLFERTIAEYEEELSRSKEENERQRKLLDAVFKPEVRLHRADVQQLLVRKEEVPPEQQDRSSSLDQEDPEPPHIKEEQEEVWSSQEGEQLQGLEEADISKFPFTPVPVKSEDDEEKPQSSQLHQTHTEQMETGADGEDCGGPEPARNSDPDQHLQPVSNDKTSDSSDPETDDSDDDWEETREAHSGLNCPNNGEVFVSDQRRKTDNKQLRCFECGKSFTQRSSLVDPDLDACPPPYAPGQPEPQISDAPQADPLRLRKSLDNKLDELRSRMVFQRDIKNCNVLVFTETWLDPSIPDSAIVPEGLSIHRQDRTINSGKSKGGGVCFMVNNKWCSDDVEIISTGCSPDLEHLMIRCRPYYLPRQRPHGREAAFIVAGDFNSANLRKVLPRYHQHISCPTRGENTLDHVYTPYADTQKLKRDRPVTQTIQQWSDQSDSALRDCFSTTEWCVFKDTDINTYTDAVIGYIGKCIDDVETIIVPVPKKTKILSLNDDYRPVALTSTIMKCFEWLVKSFITSSIPDSLDPLQFAYRPNWPIVQHSTPLCPPSSSRHQAKLRDLGLNSALCDWILNFLTGRPQAVRMGSTTSSTLTLNTGAPQGCVLSPLLYSLFTHDCVATHSSNTIIKFADDTTVIGLITGDDMRWRLQRLQRGQEVRALTSWCQDNNLQLNVSKTKELIVDFRRRQREEHAPLSINGTTVERVNSFRFLGVHISEDLTWTHHTDFITKSARQRLFFLRRLRRLNMDSRILCSFYRCTIERILTGCITAWYSWQLHRPQP